MTSLSSSSLSAASIFAVTVALLANLGGGAGDAVYYRRRPNYYVTSPYQRSPIFTSYQHVPPRIDEPIVAMVDLVPGSEDDGSVSGKLVMVQRFPESGGGVLITGRIDGLKAGKHGFHVHMKGELGNACKDAGGHFNPFSKDHGNPGP